MIYLHGDSFKDTPVNQFTTDMEELKFDFHEWSPFMGKEKSNQDVILVFF